MVTKPIPDGYHSLTPYLIVGNATEAIQFYEQAFKATEIFRLTQPNGKIGHAEIKIGDSPIMLADDCPDLAFHSPQTLGGTAVNLCLYVESVDAVFERAIALGAEVLRPVADQFYGDRAGTLKDPYGHVWTLSTHQEDLSSEELQKRFEDLVGT